MKKAQIILIKFLIATFSIGLFWWLESGFKIRNGDELLKSIIFAISLFFILAYKSKRSILWLALFLLGLMVIYYLLRNIPLANFFGSIGFGMLLIFILSFIPDLVKKGFVDEL